MGSSPRARGAQRVPEGPVLALGIIPACAGSTELGRRRRGLMGDHPRVRGEHYTLGRTPSGEGGSSPRARGARVARPPADQHRGIIPACAGSTPRRAGRSVSWRDHPRVRGEHALSRWRGSGIGGSSPRARGAPLQRPPLTRGRGIIPACAGSTRRVRRFPHQAGDHPRVRGEHLLRRLRGDAPRGSSPRARGALDRGTRRAPSPGIIPACAGSTGSPGGPGPARGDHPRVRGEHPSVPFLAAELRGSSPRARGALVPVVEKRATVGIIPACAGSTPD